MLVAAYKSVPFKNKWISELSTFDYPICWDTAWEDLVGSSKNPNHERKHFNFIHRVNRPPRKCHLMKIITSPLCDLCNQGTLGSQEVGATLIGEDGLAVMAGAESVEWYHIYQTHGLMPFHSLRSSHYYEPSSPQQPPLLGLLYAYVLRGARVWRNFGKRYPLSYLAYLI
jgi:hypothetical protein